MTAGTASRLGFELWLFVFMAFAGTTLLTTQPDLRLLALAVFALPVLVWAIVRVRGPFELLDIAILAGIGAHLLVSLSSLDRESSLESTSIVVVYAAAFWLARHVGHDPALRRTASIAVVMALTFWLVLIGMTWVAEKVADVQAFGWPPKLDAYQPYAWGSVNTPPTLVLLAAPFVAWLPGRGSRRVFLLVLAATAVVVIPFSVGRAAWLGIAVAALGAEVVFGFAMLRRATRLVMGRRMGVAAAVSLGAAALLVVWLALGRIEGVAAALDSRVRLWQQAAGMFSTDPLTGAGPTTFSWARLAHVPDYTDRVGATAAHNVPMQTLAEGGLLMGAALLVIVAAWAWQAFAARQRLGAQQRVAAAVLIGFAAFSLLDDFSFLPAVTVLVVILAAWTLPPRTEREHSGGGPRSLVTPAVLALAAILTVPTAISLGLMRSGLADARVAAFAGDWETAASGFASAARAQPSNALHWMSIGLAEHYLGRDEAAREAYRTAERISPGDPRPWGALAALSSGNEAIDLLREAARRSNDPQYAHRLASALVAQGQDDEAAVYFAIASVIRPLLYTGVPDSIRKAVGAEVETAVARVGSIGGRDPHELEWNLALEAGEVHEGAPIQWRVAREVGAGDAVAAEAALAEAMMLDARSQRTWEAASALARLTCDTAAYDRAEAKLDLIGRESVVADHRVVERRPGVYRDPELGDYQPLAEPSLPSFPQWPLGLIEVHDCG